MKEEIKDINIFEALRLLFISLLKFIVSSFRFFIRRSLYFIVIIIAGLVIGYGIYSSTDRYYKAELILKSHTMNSKEMVLLLNSWDWKNDSTISPEIKSEIKRLKATYVLDLNKDSVWDIVEDIDKNGDRNVKVLNQRLNRTFAVIILTYNPDILDDLEQIIVKRIEDNEQVKKMNTIRIEGLKQVLTQVDKEMAYLDSLRKLELNKGNKQLENTINVYNSSKAIESDNLKLLRIKQGVSKELATKAEPVEVEYFKKNKRAVNSLAWYLELSGLIAFFIAFIISLALEIKQQKLI